MILIGDYHLSLATALLGLANTLLLLVLIFGRDRHEKVSYSIRDNGGNWLGSKGVKINYCPMCGRKLTAPPLSGAIWPDPGEMAPIGDKGVEQ